MKPRRDPLERLFRSAASAPARELPHEAPFAVECRALGAWRQPAQDNDDLFSLLPLFRRGLVAAWLAVALAVAAGYFVQEDSIDETTIASVVADISYLP